MDINELFFLGVNKYGQAGIGQKYHNKTFTVPKSFAFTTFIKQISCGSHHSALLTIDGNIYTMGSNIHGALGSNPTLNYSFVPTLVQELNDVTKIDCGAFHMCAISNGQLYSWGKGIDGQLGHGNTKNVAKPMKVQGLDKNIEQVSCGTNHTLVLCNPKGDDSKVGYAFGNGIYGQLGTGQSKNSYLAVKIKLQNIESMAAGENHSLFISKGNLYSCGDNSNGQLGTLFNKKVVSQPTLVQVDGEKNCNIKLVQAKKYSLALTDSGDMYVWGLKSNFGAPKQIKSDERCEVEVIDIRASNDQIYGLAAEGTLYSWGVKSGQVKNNNLVCKKEKIISNGRAVLDFSVGDNYILILGDIVKQVPYSSVTPSLLSCYDELEPLEQTNRASSCSDNLNSQRLSVESRLVQQLKDNKSIVDSKYSDLELGDTQFDFQFLDKSSFSRNFSKMKSNYDASQIKSMNEEVQKPALCERKDFNNVKMLGNRQSQQPQRNRAELQKKMKEQLKHKQDQSLINKTKDNMTRCQNAYENEGDTFQMIKTPSSSILCEPSNFLKESTRKENYEQRKAAIYQSEMQPQDPSQEHHVNIKNSHSHKKKKYSYSYLEEKQNMNIPIQKQKGCKKQKKFDRIMEMIQKSNHISSKSNNSEIKINDEDWENEAQIVKSNRLLRIELRDKDLKISQLQQVLSRKQMQIEAQREIIRTLRQKNNSNYASQQ